MLKISLCLKFKFIYRFYFAKFVSIHYGCSPQLPSVCVLKVDAKRKESYYTKQYSFHFLNRTSTLL